MAEVSFVGKNYKVVKGKTSAGARWIAVYEKRGEDDYTIMWKIDSSPDSGNIPDDQAKEVIALLKEAIDFRIELPK